MNTDRIHQLFNELQKALEDEAQGLDSNNFPRKQHNLVQLAHLIDSLHHDFQDVCECYLPIPYTKQAKIVLVPRLLRSVGAIHPDSDEPCFKCGEGADMRADDGHAYCGDCFNEAREEVSA